MRARATNWALSSDRAGVRPVAIEVRPLYGGYPEEKGAVIELTRDRGEFRHEHLRIELHRDAVLDLLGTLASRLPEVCGLLEGRQLPGLLGEGPSREEVFRALRLAFPTSSEVSSAQRSTAIRNGPRASPSPGGGAVARPWPGPPFVDRTPAPGGDAPVIPISRARHARDPFRPRPRKV